MAQRKLFGTDGIRGLTNTEPMTAAMALRLGMAAGGGFFRKMSAKLIGEFGGSVANGLALGIRLRTKDTCGLVSRCGHQGLPTQQIS